MPETATSSSLSALVGRFAGLVGATGALSAGDVAALRRMDPREPPAAFFKLMSLIPDAVPALREERLLDLETRWASIVQGLAILGPLFDMHRPFGRALAAASESELRVSRLLRGDVPFLVDELPSLARRLRARDAAVDWTGAALLVLSADRSDEEPVRRRIARDFYASSQNAHSSP